MGLLYKGINAALSEQYHFEQKMSSQSTPFDNISKVKILRGRMVDNIYRKLSSCDLDTRPISYAAINLAERFGPVVIKTLSKASANPTTAVAFMVVAGLLLDEGTRSMVTEQVSNLASLFSTQVQEATDQIDRNNENNNLSPIQTTMQSPKTKSP